MKSGVIKTNIKLGIYNLKSDCKSSYYLIDGESILPQRLDIAFNYDISPITNKGRGCSQLRCGQIKGQYKKSDKSELKLYVPYKIHSSIFKHIDYPLLDGYATIAISNKDGRTLTEKGIAVFKKNCNDVRVYYITCECSAHNINDVCQYVNDLEILGNFI